MSISNGRLDRYIIQLVKRRTFLRDDVYVEEGKIYQYRYRHIAAIINHNTIISIGFNTSREFYSGCNYSKHAEIDALYKLPPHRRKKKKNITLLVLRITNTGKLANSKPCSNCVRRIRNHYKYRITEVYYSNSDGDIIKTTLNELVNEL